jgi:chromosome segregation ATPase
MQQQAKLEGQVKELQDLIAKEEKGRDGLAQMLPFYKDDVKQQATVQSQISDLNRVIETYQGKLSTVTTQLEAVRYVLSPLPSKIARDRRSPFFCFFFCFCCCRSFFLLRLISLLQAR